MGIFRLNHAVLYVRNLGESARFYTDVLGFVPINMTPEGFRGAAFLQAWWLDAAKARKLFGTHGADGGS